ncbi:ExbD/TolR family protein [Candidatus Sneabacter namystus]|uniref:Biopolymer transporter ExbD n=1 Tax=Candidatus Sneabacter namystus TaxID=2601646 RepID=A0A5C0UHU8_9RICK|nr:biopolymer transporter ExbD [Candidatus Sneabacter namystus]QEK39626.1 biopolymer transporter ExbD [Candidatus Sneabacter namystus]
MIPESMRRRKLTLIHDINVTPLVDVMLVLLVVFMLVSPMLVSHVDLNLPQSDITATQDSNNAIEISITKDNKIYVLDSEVEKVHLADKLKAISGRNTSKKVLISCDELVPYGKMVSVVESVKLAGFTKVGLVVKEKVR